jgi:hypothetical protein
MRDASSFSRAGRFEEVAAPETGALQPDAVIPFFQPKMQSPNKRLGLLFLTE